MKKKWTCGSHFKIKSKIIIINNKKNLNGKRGRRESDQREYILLLLLLFIFSLTSLFDIWKSDRQNSSG